MSVISSPFPELVEKVSSAADLLRLTNPQLDELLLKIAADRANSTNPIANKYIYDGSLTGLYPVGMGNSFQDSAAADSALVESWSRLLTNGLIMQAPGQATGNRTVTAKGGQVANASSFKEMLIRQQLSRDMLHAALQEAVYENFASGNYDVAVLDAFVILEDAVRTAANFGPRDIGVQLMRTAFSPTNGPLTNFNLPPAERERIADLFAGAIGTFKNPLSHRKLGKSDPSLVIEELMLASRLLRFVK